MRPPLSLSAHTSPEFRPKRQNQANRPAIGATAPYCRFHLPSRYGRGRASEPPGADARLRQRVQTLLRSLFVLGCGSAVYSLRERESCGGPAQETGVTLQRQCGDQILFQGNQRDSPLTDHKLASIEGMSTPPRLNDRDAAVKRVVDFHQAHQNEVINDRANRKIWHVG